jgi:predicted RNase H-like HicB family nuclease
MHRYVALLHRDRRGGYGVSFPDFPGCISAGEDWITAVDAAAQALRLHTEGLIADGAAIPVPRSPEALRRDRAFAEDFEDAVVTLVPLLPARGRQERINITMDDNLLHEIDAAAEAAGLSRSAFLAEGARRMLGAGAGAPPDIRHAEPSARSGRRGVAERRHRELPRGNAKARRSKKEA